MSLSLLQANGPAGLVVVEREIAGRSAEALVPLMASLRRDDIRDTPGELPRRGAGYEHAAPANASYRHHDGLDRVITMAWTV